MDSNKQKSVEALWGHSVFIWGGKNDWARCLARAQF